jgi:hypothetical protein
MSTLFADLRSSPLHTLCRSTLHAPFSMNISCFKYCFQILPKSNYFYFYRTSLLHALHRDKVYPLHKYTLLEAARFQTLDSSLLLSDACSWQLTTLLAAFNALVSSQRSCQLSTLLAAINGPGSFQRSWQLSTLLAAHNALGSLQRSWQLSTLLAAINALGSSQRSWQFSILLVALPLLAAWIACILIIWSRKPHVFYQIYAMRLAVRLFTD